MWFVDWMVSSPGASEGSVFYRTTKHWFFWSAKRQKTQYRWSDGSVIWPMYPRKGGRSDA